MKHGESAEAIYVSLIGEAILVEPTSSGTYNVVDIPDDMHKEMGGDSPLPNFGREALTLDELDEHAYTIIETINHPQTEQ